MTHVIQTKSQYIIFFELSTFDFMMFIFIRTATHLRKKKFPIPGSIIFIAFKINFVSEETDHGLKLTVPEANL